VAFGFADLIATRSAFLDVWSAGGAALEATKQTGAVIMLSKRMIVLSAVLILAGASAASSKGGDLPTIDVQKGCRAAEAELTALFGSGTNDAFKTCVDSEQAGRDQLLKDWDTFPALAKAKCVQPKEYLPSYIEWQTCLEMTRDVMKLRESASQAGGKSDKSARRQCPVVEIGTDGNIISVIAC
jgi:hypothetical protein